MKRPAATAKQKLAFRYALKNPYSIIAMDPRLGKSRVAIAIREKLNLNCLVVCPGYLVPNWPKEIFKWVKRKDPMVTVFQKGSQLYDVCDADYVVISYDLAKKADFLFEWADMVVLDEGHHLKSMVAKRTEFIHKNIYENSIPRMHVLTGTILKNRVKEFYSPLALTYYNPSEREVKFLDLYPSEIDFADQFSYRREFKVKVKTKRGRTVKMQIAKWEGLRNVDELRQHLKGRYIRIKADEKDLPPVQYKSIYVSDTPNRALLDAFNLYFEGEGTGSVKPDIKATAALKKTPFTIKYAEDLLEERDCVLIYSDHVASCEAIAQHFGVPAVTGKMSGASRAVIAADFQAGKGRMICATIGALKEGQDLFRAKDIIFNDYPWVPGDLKQVVNRIRGLGQKAPRTVHKIVGSPQDDYIMQAIEEKLLVIEAAT